MEFVVIISEKCNTDVTQFWQAIDIWLNKPHVINRRILVSSRLITFEYKETESELINWINELHFSSLETHEENYVFSQKLFHNSLKINANHSSFIDLEANRKFINISKLLPRNQEIFSPTLEVTLVDKETNRITSFYKCFSNEKQSLCFQYPYRISFENSEILMSVEKNYANNSCFKWLKEQLFPRLVKWTMDEGEMKNSFINGSLNLVPMDRYADLYSKLKEKYGAEIVKIWPENTDPLKFVYEDIAIATYLLIIWEKEREELAIEEKQSFLDLGCGNGLLVHILSREGHNGLGIDLRERKIWHLFPESTHLEVRTIIPSSKSLFPGVDWLIGNHSDELTPWIPVIAARSSYKCRFFLLPCCPYEFDGRKYQRESASRSQYLDYMHYIKRVSEECGFQVQVDKLRIPSTKRTCFIGKKRIHPPDTDREKEIKTIIKERSLQKSDNDFPSQDQWSLDFKPRETVEKVRNCTQIDKNLIDEIVNIVANFLLSKTRIISLDSEKKWNAGGQMELSQLVAIIPEKSLKSLKNECGGLQTLLKNKGHIFCVQGGKVSFRIPGSASTSRKQKKNRNTVRKIRKEKNCWFNENHPDGCPLTDEICDFKH